MATPQKKSAKTPSRQNTNKPPVYKEGGSKASSFFDNLNSWLNSRQTAITAITFGSCLLFSILLFQARMDMGGDDSAYILKAYDFLHKGAFPTYQAPLYPIVLSLFIAIVGVKVIWLKILSVIFNLAALFVLFKAFKDRLPAFVFFPVMIITAINASINNYASLTYSEAFFMLLQASTLLFFFRLNDTLEKSESPTLKETYKNWLLVGLFIFFLSFARNIGFAGLLGFMLFFAMRRQYKYALYLLGAVMVFQIPMVLLEKTVWHLSGQWSDQGATLMLKDPYDAAKGNETFTGFFVRFFGNCNLYLSKRFFQIVGFRATTSTDTNSFLTFLFILSGLFAFYRIVKAKNTNLLATILYTAGMVSGSFFALQTRWDQPRIIMVFVPLILFLVLYGFYDALKKTAWAGQILLFLALVVPLFIAGLASTVKASKDNVKILQKNLQGDIFYGYTPDWVNYLRMSRWCADSLPKDASVAVRKAPISFIYTGKKFYPVYKAYYTDADSVLNYFQKYKVDYIMLASLRMNPAVNDGNIVNTLWQMLAPVAKKYPQKLKLVHQEGTSEPAYLYRIVR